MYIVTVLNTTILPENYQKTAIFRRTEKLLYRNKQVYAPKFLFGSKVQDATPDNLPGCDAVINCKAVMLLYTAQHSKKVASYSHIVYEGTGRTLHIDLILSYLSYIMATLASCFLLLLSCGWKLCARLCHQLAVKDGFL